MMIEIKICFSTTGALKMDESVLRALKAAAVQASIATLLSI